VVRGGVVTFRKLSTTLLELAGFGLIVAGAWLENWILGLVVLGAALVAVGALNA
jgi:hypothetical protein